ncbi:hypothetical protein NMY22_g5627 [Coprinellus aureogranulatus]|nr:hypothetical protein NMY22_g5627 [Coprinellus aureogranulatus]
MEFLPYEGNQSIEAHARYFTDRHLVPYEKSQPFFEGVDPAGTLKDLQPQQFIHAPDNYVEYLTRTADEREGERSERSPPPLSHFCICTLLSALLHRNHALSIMDPSGLKSQQAGPPFKCSWCPMVFDRKGGTLSNHERACERKHAGSRKRPEFEGLPGFPSGSVQQDKPWENFGRLDHAAQQAKQRAKPAATASSKASAPPPITRAQPVCAKFGPQVPKH